MHHARAEPGGGAQPEVVVVQFRLLRPRDHHEVLAVQDGQRHLRQGRQRMAARQRGYHRLLVHGLGVQAAAAEGDPHERDVDPPRLHALHRGPVGRLLQHQPHARVPLAVAAQHRRQHAVQRWRYEADDQHTGLAAARRRGPLGRQARLGEHVPGVGQERPPGVGQLHPPPAAQQQPHAELVLQHGDLLAQRWLHDVQVPGGPAEVQLLSDRDEVPQMPQLHQHRRPSRRPVAGPPGHPVPIFCYTEIVDNISGTF